MSDAQRCQWLLRCLGALAAALIGVTWLLWTPQRVYPQVPFFAVLTEAPPLLDWLGLAGLLLAASLMALAPTDAAQRIGAVVWLVSVLLMVALDQHRLQPWAYQFSLFAGLALLLPPAGRLVAMRWIVISLYVYSAISKWDYQFLHTVGPDMVTSLGGLLGLERRAGSAESLALLAALLPTGEMLVALLLALPRTSSWAWWLALAMHAGLLAILGPWGLGHRPGVLLWNLFFMAQARLLWGGQRLIADSAATGQSVTSRFSPVRMATGWTLTGWVLFWPLLQPWGLCDHWLAWELYAPRTSRASLEWVIPWEQVRSMAPQQASDPLDSWRDPGQASLERLGVPAYPQARFQLGVLLAVSEELAAAGWPPCEILLESESDRWTGQRDRRVIRGQDQVQQESQRYWWNVRARSLFRNPTGPPQAARQ